MVQATRQKHMFKATLITIIFLNISLIKKCEIPQIYSQVSFSFII